MKQSMSLSAKLSAAFAAMIALALIVSVGSFVLTSGMRGDFDDLNQTAEQRLQSFQIANAAARALSAERGLILRSILQQQAGVERSKQEFREASQTLDQVLKELHAANNAAAKPSVESIRARYSSLTRAHDEILAALSREQFDVVQKISEERAQPLAQQIADESAKLVETASAAAMAATQSVEQRAALSNSVMGAMIVLAIAVGAVVALVLRSASQSLRGLAAEMAQGSAEVASAAAQVAQSSQALAQAASEQAATLEETAASSQELAGMTRSNLEHTRSAAQSVATSDQQVHGANRTLEQMVVSMQDISASSAKISRIIKVIDEIAFQTNILALNAAVEAARAGEAGMGFAVVADEVRNLAQRCAQAAKDTADLIEESIEKSSSGESKVTEVVDAIAQITKSSVEIKGLVEKVNHSSLDQARSIDQISASVGQMQRVTQSTAASAEQGAASSEELSAQAEAMRNAVERLRLLVGGAASAGARTSPKRPASPAVAAASRKTAAPAARRGAESSRAGSATVADPFPMEGDFREF